MTRHASQEFAVQLSATPLQRSLPRRATHKFVSRCVGLRLAVAIVQIESQGAGISVCLSVRGVCLRLHHQRAERQQAVRDVGHQLFAHQHLAASRTEDGRINHMFGPVALQQVDDYVQRLARAHQANLHYPRRHIIHHGLHLPAHDASWQVEELLNAKRRLHGH